MTLSLRVARRFQAKTPAKESPLKEFDLYGMKIVVDDRTVTPEQVDQYVKFLDKAYASLRAKGLQDVWYGTVFIRCQECGGENAWSDKGVGGLYHSGPDLVQVFVRPSAFVSELVVHELGHRYWFKFMSSEQRARFDGIVRAPDRLKKHPKMPLSSELYYIHLGCRDLGQAINRIRTYPQDAIEFHFPVAVVAPVHFLLKTLTKLRKYTTEESLQPLVEEVKALAVLAGSYTRFKALLRKSGHPFQEALEGWADAVSVYFERIKKEARQLDPKDTSRVAPVSDYGGSNIREAFAEAFKHYVMEKDMARDQLESFRSVLSSVSEDLVARVLMRYLEAL